MLVARQNGKTSVIEIKNLWKLYVQQVSLIVSTAQVLDIAEESWEHALEIVEGTEDLKAELQTISKVNGKKQFKLTNGARWKIAAASRRARGFSGAEDVNLDELREHRDWLAWGAITKTTLARRHAQVYAFSNAGDDSSVPLNALQRSGRLAAKDPALADASVGFFEWSMPDDIRCDCGRSTVDHPHAPGCSLIDIDNLAMANPSMGHPGGVSFEALVSAANTDPDEVFLTECGCVRVPSLTVKIIDPVKWDESADPLSRRVGDVAIAVDIALDRSYTAIGLYGKRADGLGHLQIVDHAPGVGWVVNRLVELNAILNPVAVGMARGTYESLKDELRAVGIMRPEDRPASGPKDNPHPPYRGDLAVLSAPDMAAACGQLIDAVRESTLRHVPHRPLTDAVRASRTRQTGGAVAWSPVGDGVDITPVPAVTEARWAYHKRVDVVRASAYDPAGDLW
jgi:hypothetical protein